MYALVLLLRYRRKPNGSRAQEIFQRAAEIGAVRAAKKRVNLDQHTQAAFFNLAVCLRDDLGAPARADGTYRYNLNKKEADKEWENFKASRAEWMARTYRTADDYQAAKEKFIKRLRRRESEQAAARKKLSLECFEKCKNAWQVS